jgi:hypothetical protein
LPLLAVSFLLSAAQAQQVGTNVNMVTGTQWPGGDPFLQRQNEPSMAISSRNPLHMVAGDNDYRSVDLPAVSGETAPTGDAWLGFFTSFDGGQTWTSNLVPGYPQDTSAQGVLSPLHGLGAGADPSVRAGTNGMFYYGGLAFNRQQGGTSKVFVATYTDDNDVEGSNSIRYLWTTAVDTGNANLFEDKPSIAVDIPRSWSGTCVIPALPLKNSQIFRAGTVYAAWTQFTGNESNGVAAIMYSRSIDCGLTWTPPQQISGSAKTNQGASLAIDPNTGALYIAWRVFASTSPTQSDAIMYVASFDGGCTFTKPALVANINAFDQGDTFYSFRTNDYPVITVDSASRAYVAWSQRNVGNTSANGGDARVVVSTGIPTSNPKSIPLQWSAPLVVDNWAGRGHQFMPGMEFSAGKLTVAWYDLRNDDLLAIYTALGVAGGFSETFENDGGDEGTPSYPLFGTYIQDPEPPYSSNARRQTLDVRAAQATPGDPPTFFPSVQVSDYSYGSVPGTTEIQQLQVDPPNLPMFQSGTLPFFGDYIDIAGPTFIPLENGSWRFNNQPTDPDFTHVVWADNRDVVPPADGNWANYTPPTYGTSSTSIFDPTQTRPACTTQSTGNTGDRNQNIYTAQLAPGLVLSSPGNFKQLGTGSNGQLIQRQFAVVVANTTPQVRYYQLNVTAQPTGGAASFLQFAVAGQPFPLTQIQVEVPPLSSTSRGLFVTSTNATASVTVTAEELTALNGSVVSGGETATLTINGDPNNPTNVDTNIGTAESYTPSIATPNIANPNIANPNIANPNIANPNIANPNIANPNIANPNIANPNIANPNIANPNIANPNIANTALSDGTITDGTWAVTNMGNTSSAYAVNLTGRNPPAGVALQLIIYQNYTTPLAQNCTLTTESHFVPVANITSPTFATLSQLLQPAANNPTLPALALPPGQTAYITLRVYDANTNNPAQALLDYNPITQATPAVVAVGANTGTTQPPVTLTVFTKALPQATLTGVYPAQTLQATGGSGAYTWSTASGALPAGIALSAAGVISGTPTGTPGTSSFTVQVKDAAGDIAQQALTLVVNAAPAISPTHLAAATQTETYSQTFTATSGTAPFTWSASGLPSWLTFNAASATLSGTAATGSFNFTIKVTDANGVSASTPYTLLVNAAPAISPSHLTTATQSETYSQAFTVSAGTAPFTWSASGLPSWLTFNAATATLSGTAATGSFTFTIKVTDANGVSASTPYTLLVNAAPTISPASLSAATQSETYSQVFTVSSGTAPFTWSASGLPSWLTFNAATAKLSGTATAGSFTFTVKVTDANGVSASMPYTLLVNPAPTISPASLAAATQSEAYSQVFTVSSGTAPFTWSASGLPSWLTFNAMTAKLSGTATTGSFTFTVKVTDANGVSASTPYTLLVNPAPTISPASLAAATQSEAYSQVFTVSAGTAPFTWSASGLPSWLTFNSATATLSGAATTGSFTFTVKVTDANGVSASTPYTLLVNPAPVILPATLPAANQYATYSQQFSVTPGTGTPPFTWSAVTLPSFLGFNPATQILSGTPMVSGSFPVTIKVTDANGVAASPTYSLLVNAVGVVISTSSLPSGEYGAPYTFTPSATSGTAPYTWSLGPGGVLPVGMSLTSGTISGAPAQAGQWSVPLMVTDSSVPPTTQTVTLPLTIGLATGYAGGGNCYMPYPTTPLYYPGATAWTLTNSTSPTLSAEMSILQGNILTGCPSGLNSGSYTLTFNVSGGPSSFALPVFIVGQDTQDNGQFNANTGGIGLFNNPPPSGYQQGVLAPGQYFDYGPSYGADSPTFSGNFLFGFSGSAPQDCGNGAALSDGIALSPPQAGRYDIIFDGTNQDCSVATFPTSPAPLVINSVDAVGTTVTFGNPTGPQASGETVSSVSVSSSNSNAQTQQVPNVLDIIQLPSATTIPVSLSLNYALWNSACPDCIDELQIGLNTDPGPQVCAYVGIDGPLPGITGSGNVNVNVPNIPGRYYVGIDRSEDFGCLYSSPNWANGPPSPPRYIAVIDVWSQ